MAITEFFVKSHGGQLVNLLVDPDKEEAPKMESQQYPSLTLTQRQVCDLELLMNGAFSLLTGFMNPADYESVVDNKPVYISGRIEGIQLPVHHDFESFWDPRMN